VTIDIPSSALPGAFAIKVKTQDTSGTPSHSATINLTLAQDFTVTSSTPSQTVTAGQTSGPYALRVQPVGTSFTGAVTLACIDGLPTGAQCLFSPSTPVTPGNSAVDVVMSISTSKSSRSSSQFRALAIWLLVPGLVVAGGLGVPKPKRMMRLVLAVVALFFLVFLVSCAGVSAGGGGDGGTQNPVSYQVTVTGTSPGTVPDSGQSTVVTLVVN